MKKLRTLRDYLLACPLNIQADKLVTWAQKGTVTSHAGMAHQNRNFGVRYDAHIILTDFAGDDTALLYLLTAWLHQHQPNAKPDAITFQVDVIDHDLVDISISLPLDEAVLFEQLPEGIRLTPAQDPDALLFGLFPP